MKLEDIVEALCTCCCSVDDELKMSALAEDLVQVCDGTCCIHVKSKLLFYCSLFTMKDNEEIL